MNITAALSLCLLVATPAFAEGEPLLTKINGAGYTMPADSRSERCAVYADRVVIERMIGVGDEGFHTTETRMVSISPSIMSSIERAMNEPVESRDNSLCDAPGSIIKAGDVVLFETGGCGAPRHERQGSATRQLRDLIDAYCPTTYDYAW